MFVCVCVYVCVCVCVCVCVVVVVVLSAAAVTTLAGNTTAGFFNALGSNANFNNPTDVAVDASGNVFVVDTNNHRIRKVTPGGGTPVGPVTLARVLCGCLSWNAGHCSKALFFTLLLCVLASLAGSLVFSFFRSIWLFVLFV
jgi:hypothetical protein